MARKKLTHSKSEGQKNISASSVCLSVFNLNDVSTIASKRWHETCWILTETAQLFNDGSQGAVCHALQLTGHPIRQGSSAQVPGLYVPLHQRHDALILEKDTGKQTWWAWLDSTCHFRMRRQKNNPRNSSNHVWSCLTKKHSHFVGSLYHFPEEDEREGNRLELVAGRLWESWENSWAESPDGHGGVKSAVGRSCSTLLNVNAARTSQKPNGL